MVRHVLAAPLAAALMALAGCKTTGVAERTPNPGSHLPSALYSEVLAGRVAIQFEAWTGDWSHWLVTSATYHHPDGHILECTGEKRRYRAEVHQTHSPFTRSGEGWTAAVEYRDGTLAPVFYNPDTGRLHVEEWRAGRGDYWSFSSDGWVQESWPRFMADACPELPIPDHVPINNKQTHPTIWKLLDQDPNAPYRHTSLPATHTGVAAAHPWDIWYWCFKAPGRPELPAHCPFDIHDRLRGADHPGEETEPTAALSDDPEHAARLRFAALLKENNGTIVTDALGREYVLALHAEGDELWAVDEAGEILDIGHLAWNAATRRVELDWETFPATRDYAHRPGDALPVFATDERHPLFAVTDWLVAANDDVVLPYMGRDAIFRFAEGGALTVRGVNHDVGGSWLVSRGRLVLAVDGIAPRAAYRWDLLRRHLAAQWYSGMSADVTAACPTPSTH